MSRSIQGVVALMLCCAAGFVFAAESKKDPGAEFRAGSLWQGEVKPDPRHADREAHPAQFRVLTLNGEKFTARYAVKDPNNPRSLELEGAIKDGKFEAKASKLIHGSFDKDIMSDPWKGEVKDDEMVLQHTNSKNLVATIHLKLDRKGHDDADEKPKHK